MEPSLQQQYTDACLIFSPYGLLMQALLGLLSFLTLVLKKYTDKWQRTWKIWLMVIFLLIPYFPRIHQNKSWDNCLFIYII